MKIYYNKFDKLCQYIRRELFQWLPPAAIRSGAEAFV